MLDLFPSTIDMLEVVDEEESHAENFHPQVQKSSFPTILYLKKGILVELIGANLDTQDGLVNGVDGVFQLHTKNDKDILWIEFNDTTIGISRRKKMQHLYTNSISPSWTPIMRIAKKMKTSTKFIVWK